MADLPSRLVASFPDILNNIGQVKPFLERKQTRARPLGFFSWLDHFEFSAPLIELWSSYPQLSRQLIDTIASSQFQSMVCDQTCMLAPSRVSDHAA